MIGIFLDLSKGFDSLNHKILLSKLQHAAIRGASLELSLSYLSNRSQPVTCNNKSSQFIAISRGVPQGSIIGPILFLIHNNDIVTHLDLASDQACLQVLLTKC